MEDNEPAVLDEIGGDEGQPRQPTAKTPRASIDSLYKHYQSNKRPETLTPLIGALQPTIDKAIKTYGYTGDPSVRTAAQLHVAKAIERFDPSRGAALPTFVFTELQRLQRIGSKQSFAIPMPEQAALDLKAIRNTSEELKYELGREPNSDELADATGISHKRLEYVMKKYNRPSISEAAFTTDEGSKATPGTVRPDTEQLWMDLTHAQLSPTDKKIMEWSTGMRGSERLTKSMIAARLGISVPAVSQRAARIAKQLEEGYNYQVI